MLVQYLPETFWLIIETLDLISWDAGTVPASGERAQARPRVPRRQQAPCRARSSSRFDQVETSSSMVQSSRGNHGPVGQAQR